MIVVFADAPYQDSVTKCTWNFNHTQLCKIEFYAGTELEVIGVRKNGKEFIHFYINRIFIYLFYVIIFIHSRRIRGGRRAFGRWENLGKFEIIRASFLTIKPD